MMDNVTPLIIEKNPVKLIRKFADLTVVAMDKILSGEITENFELWESISQSLLSMARLLERHIEELAKDE